MILFIVLLVLAILLYLAWGFYKVLVIDKRNYALYWKKLAAQPTAPGAIRLLAMGDSTFQSMGASRPELGTVGRVATYLAEKTGRPVHVTNLSVSGATARAVVDNQLPHADVDAADIIIVAVGVNDVRRSVSLDDFQNAMRNLADQLPPQTTIMADVALVKNREQHQNILDEIRTKRGLRQADLGHAFVDAPSGRRLSGRDFFHPSDYGYTFWFRAFQPAVDDIIKEHRLAK